uniref:Uncharacterized protein n=1 Tax=Nelumbo nucifera TaxID=4432 RepID=A0A823A2P8_NELNU|nr:TPA_asm: hypothetical protein HUJ06_019123 [Nelumbo nucifera]
MVAISVNPLDVPIVGDGAIACGVALDAMLWGLRIGLIEIEDFLSQTSPKSTK